MISGLNKDIIRLFKSKFENDCISLLLRSYNTLKNTGRNFREFNENDITAQLVGLMKNDPTSMDLQITIGRECYLDSEQTYLGFSKADESPRIDIKYTVWNSNVEHEYYMEAKNLAENNWRRKGSYSLVDSSKLIKRYIETGIGNFTVGKYHNGCLLGYVLEGEPCGIVDKINGLLTKTSRVKEKLLKREHNNHDDYYISRHDKLQLTLKHFLLLFTANKTKKQ